MLKCLGSRREMTLDSDSQLTRQMLSDDASMGMASTYRLVKWARKPPLVSIPLRDQRSCHKCKSQEKRWHPRRESCSPPNRLKPVYSNHNIFCRFSLFLVLTSSASETEVSCCHLSRRQCPRRLLNQQVRVRSLTSRP